MSISGEFDDVINALHARGISAYFSAPWSVVVSKQKGPPWPDAGNSFSICKVAGRWYVCTWAPNYYLVPVESSVLEVSAAFVDVGTRAQFVMEDDLMKKFSLQHIDDGEFKRLWDANRPGV
jgi:hypothetical protein